MSQSNIDKVSTREEIETLLNNPHINHISTIKVECFKENIVKPMLKWLDIMKINNQNVDYTIKVSSLTPDILTLQQIKYKNTNINYDKQLLIQIEPISGKIYIPNYLQNIIVKKKLIDNQSSVIIQNINSIFKSTDYYDKLLTLDESLSIELSHNLDFYINIENYYLTLLDSHLEKFYRIANKSEQRENEYAKINNLILKLYAIVEEHTDKLEIYDTSINTLENIASYRKKLLQQIVLKQRNNHKVYKLQDLISQYYDIIEYLQNYSLNSN